MCPTQQFFKLPFCCIWKQAYVSPVLKTQGVNVYNLYKSELSWIWSTKRNKCLCSGWYIIDLLEICLSKTSVWQQGYNIRLLGLYQYVKAICHLYELYIIIRIKIILMRLLHFLSLSCRSSMGSIKYNKEMKQYVLQANYWWQLLCVFFVQLIKVQGKKQLLWCPMLGKKIKCKPVLKYVTFSRSRHSSQVLELKLPNVWAVGCSMLVTDNMKVQVLAVWDFWFL